MNNRMKSFALALFLVVVVFFIGCIPENSLEWSDDGSVGLLRVNGALYFVDGQTGELTEITKENVQPWPDISKDGSLVAYSLEVDCNNLSDALKLLSAGQVKMILYNAKKMSEDILKSGGLADGKFPEPEENLLKPESYKNWAIRYMCENADSELLKVLGDEGIKKGKEMSLNCFQIVVVPRNNLNDKRIVATNIFGTVGTQLSPNNQYVAYIMQTQYGQEDAEYSLYVASLKGDMKTMLVDQRVALGYDWRKDSRALAYMNADTENVGQDEPAFGSLQERIVTDQKNNLLANPVKLENKENGSVEMFTCNSKVSSLAGLIFYPWQKVRYGLDGRIFFSTCSMPLPISKKDEPGWSLFCYDSVTGIVSNVLPQSVSVYTSQAMDMLQFEISPDGERILLPIKKNRLVDYELGTDKVGLPIFEDEEFGEEEIPALVPTFKGNDEITFLVSEKSHYLTEAKGEKPNRYEIIVLNRTSLKGRILSQTWPDELMNDLKDQK